MRESVGLGGENITATQEEEGGRERFTRKERGRESRVKGRVFLPDSFGFLVVPCGDSSVFEMVVK